MMSDRNASSLRIARRIDELCMQFELEWQSGTSPRLEAFLEQWDAEPEYRPRLFAELLHIELDALEESGIQPSVSLYAQRYPEFLEQIERVFQERSQQLADSQLTETYVPSSHSAPSSIVDCIGRYEVVKELGRGAFGTVYLAHDPRLDCPVAIKQLNIDKFLRACGAARTDAAKIIDDLLREARLAAKLRQYAGIVAVLDVLVTGDEHSPEGIYFVQEFIDGGSLKEHLERGPIAPADAARILQQVAAAMNHVHEHGIYHRDLKPANIILDSRRTPCVVDFGLAVDDRLQKSLRGEVSGTVPYMAPEQTRGEVHLLDGRADIWALGVILYEMLTGRRPFAGRSLTELTEEICHRVPRPLRMIRPQVPAELERICLKCLAKRMTDRYATAADVSDELQAWLTDLQSDAASATAAPKSTVRVIPKGLRSFEDQDADFFLQLLPGPRDRHGIPESIRFWKQRIEEKDAEKTFRVGALYGPSGCGKSSLIKAGLLPRLSRVIPAYVESTAADTEARLFRQLRLIAPQLPAELALPEAITALREHPELTGFQKVVLVLDQFEQWLQARRAFGREQLIEALRQCDGSRIQALILVRDDFWMAVTRFLHELEVDLVPGQNVAAVDLFPPDHARHVLTKFGRAYGKISEYDTPSPEQNAFIASVVDGLAREGTVVCVRLAVFAEMVKSREWVPATIEQVGGTDGIGERFLDEAFSARSANPRHRLHEHAARKVLQALLPDIGAQIKGHMRSREELLERSGYHQDPKAFHELLTILDSELRLVTPTDPDGLRGSPGESGAQDGDGSADAHEAGTQGGRIEASYYQLTHDYLVPSLREWLTRAQRSSRRGRAQLLLGELTEAWQLKPDPRRLPSPLEWLSLVWWTRRSERTAAQQELMQASSRRLMRGGFAWSLGLVLLLWVGYEANGRFQAAATRDQLVSADTKDLRLVMPDVRKYRVWNEPLLTEELARIQNGPPPEDPAEAERIRRSRSHLELALAVLDAGNTEPVLDRLKTIPVEHLEVVAELLPSPPETVETLWQRLAEARDARSSQEALGLAALLANFAPDDRRWQNHAAWIADQLSRSRSLDAAHWRDLFAPIRHEIAPVLVEQAGAATQSISQRGTAMDLITEYAVDMPDLLASAVQWAEPDKLAQLISTLTSHQQHALPAVQEQLRALRAERRLAVFGQPDESASAPISESLKQRIANAAGVVDERSALVQRIDRQSFESLYAALQDAGYVAECLRPYHEDGTLFVAACWQRRPGRAEILWELQVEQIEEADRAMRRKGLQPVDFARYGDRADAQDGNAQWVVVWSTPSASDAKSASKQATAEADDSATRFVTAASLVEYREQASRWPQERFTLRRFDLWLADDGAPRCTAIWTRGVSESTETFADWRYARAFGDVSPGALQSDIRLKPIAPQSRDRFGLFKHLSRAEYERDDASQANRRDTKLLALAKYRTLLGDFEHAQKLLDDLSTRWRNKSSLFHKYCAELAARRGQADALRTNLHTYSRFPSHEPPVLHYLNLRAALLADDPEAVQQHLESLEAAAPDASDIRELLARAHALLAAATDDAAQRAAHVQDSVALLKSLIETDHVELPSALIFDVDFDGIRSAPEFQAAFREMELDRLLITSYSESQQNESQQLWGLAPEVHLAETRALLAAGFRPNAISIRPMRAHVDAPSKEDRASATRPVVPETQCCSVWHRTIAGKEVRIEWARREANLLLAAAALGDDSGLRRALSTLKQPDVRSQLTLNVARVLTVPRIRNMLDTAHATTERQAWILILGASDEVMEDATIRAHCIAQVSALLDIDHSSIRSAALWCLRRWDAGLTESPGPDTVTSELLTTTGQRLLVVSPPEQFLMGSPAWEPGRGDQETRFWTQIPRTYALAARETTLGEFQKFVDDPRIQQDYSRRARFNIQNADPNLPITGVTWFDAALFCQWLSEQDPDIPEDQYCYPGIWQSESESESLELPADYLTRTGYRLPTEAEWEWAARAGVVQAMRFTGDDDRTLSGYAWHAGNARRSLNPTGFARPNPFGFFDMLGNASEWCDDLHDPYYRPLDGYLRIDDAGNERLPQDNQWCAVRGGTYQQLAEDLRSANRWFQFPTYRSPSTGFRVARTLTEER